jgi:hypothetical protein
MTARASTPEYSCSACRSLVLRACGAADLTGLPSCSGCGRVTCDACELLGYCPICAARLWTPPADVGPDERTLVVVAGSSAPGSRPSFSAQPFDGDADDSAA